MTSRIFAYISHKAGRNRNRKSAETSEADAGAAGYLGAEVAGIGAARRQAGDDEIVGSRVTDADDLRRALLSDRLTAKNQACWIGAEQRRRQSSGSAERNDVRRGGAIVINGERRTAHSRRLRRQADRENERAIRRHSE